MGELTYRLDMLKKPVWKFVSAAQFAKDNLLYIQEAGHFSCGDKYYTKRTGLNSFLIMVTISGKGILEYCDEKYEINPGTVMFIDCRRRQHYYTDSSTKKWEMSWVHFNGKSAQAYYKRFLEKNNNTPVAMLADDNSLNEILENITETAVNYAKSPENDIIADNLLNTLLKECVITSGAAKSAVPGSINRIAHYIRHNYRENISLDFLAKEFNISKYHLQRTFKEVIGTSPAKYLSNIRINRAKSLLRGTNLTVSEISERIGMETNYFIQVFKSSENMTPKHYRNNWSGNAD